ncbi:MAG TPA: endonuclease/exonuclease/phosphatase family protein [Caulobacteraceae bacterium]
MNFAAGLAAGLSLLGLLSAAGAWNQTLDLLNHATPAFVGGGLLGLVVGWANPGLRQRRLLMVLGVAGALAAGMRVVPEALTGSQPVLTPNALRVTLLTQNVWDANGDPHATARALAATGADIILLQELETPAARTVARDLERRYPYVADCSLVNRWCALAIVSRLPISAWSYHQGGWKAPDWDRLVLVRATIDSPVLGRFEVIDTKLVHPYTGDLQQTQISRLVDRVRGGDQDHAILTGDFNLTPWSFALRRVDRSIAMLRRTRGLATWPNRLPLPGRPFVMPFAILPIDQVYAGSAWRTVSVTRGPRTASDHYGVLVTLTPSQDKVTR